MSWCLIYQEKQKVPFPPILEEIDKEVFWKQKGGQEAISYLFTFSLLSVHQGTFKPHAFGSKALILNFKSVTVEIRIDLKTAVFQGRGMTRVEEKNALLYYYNSITRWFNFHSVFSALAIHDKRAPRYWIPLWIVYTFPCSPFSFNKPNRISQRIYGTAVLMQNSWQATFISSSSLTWS